jgi:transposase
MSVYVGIDVHRKRSQVAVVDESGKVLANRNVPNAVEPFLKVIGGLPPGTPAAFEAAYGTSWLVELLESYGFTPHLVHASRCKAIASARLKNDKVGASILAQLLRVDLLPEAWIAPPEVRQLRALLRHRVALVRLRTLLRNRIHAIVADHGYDRPAGEYWSGPGRAWLASLELPAVSRELAGDDLALIGALETVIDRLDWEIRQRGRSDPRVKVLTQLPGVGPFTALVILAEVGDVSRFGSARKLASWAGPATGRARQRPRRPLRAHLENRGSVLLRWALCEAAQTAKRSPQFAATFQPSPNGAGRRSPPQRSPASCSPAPGTYSPTPGTQSRHPLQHPPPRKGRGDRPGGGRQAPGELEDLPEPGHGPRSEN